MRDARGSEAPFGALGPAWFSSAAALVERGEDPDLPQRLIEGLLLLVAFEFSTIFVYRGTANPIHVFDTFEPAARRGLLNYVNNTYVLNPFYNAYRRGLPTGVYRLRDLAPDAYFESQNFAGYKVSQSASEEIGYITEGWPAGREEVSFAFELPDGECGEISLSQTTESGGFSEESVATLRMVLPFAAAVFRRYWRTARNKHLQATPDRGIDEAFQAFGGERLSPREREVAQLLLRGHSSHSIASQLAISGTTVKSHRKNLYGKLGIATHFELFSLFIKSLGR